LVTGAGCYVDDLRVPGCLHVAFLRSFHAHARLTPLDLSGADHADGVVAVYSGKDVASLENLAVNPIFENLRIPRYPVLAQDTVRAVGEPIAAVVAESAAQAQDALEGIEVEYEPLEAVSSPTVAAEVSSLFPELAENTVLEKSWLAGNVDSAFAAAAATVRVQLEYPRLAPTPLEPRSVLASWNPDEEAVTLWCGSQSPHRTRTELARLLELDAQQVRVIAPDVGGAFGMKASPYPEEVLVAWAACRLKRAVRWTATRSEDFMTATHGRGASLQGELAVAADGRLLGLRAEILFPLGRWLPYSAVIPTWNAARILPGPYAVEAVGIQARACVTNTAPVGIYRGAGRPEAAMLMERLLDAAARQLGADPVELRRRNLLAAEQLPHASATGAVLDSGDYPAALQRLCDAADYKGLRALQKRRRAEGKCFGIGLCCYVEPCGQGWESAGVRLERDGRLTAVTGSSQQGQGRETAAAQIVAEVFRMAPERVTVRCGDTQDTPNGIGALASRSTAIGGSALLLAARETLEKARSLAAEVLGGQTKELTATEAGLAHPDRPGAVLSWESLAESAHALENSTAGNVLETHLTYHTEGEAWGYGGYLAAVSVDPDTGVVSVEQLVCVDDAGVLVNPMLVEGQIVGGIAQGLGEVLMERVVYDDEGQLLTGSLLDYALPRADSMPAIRLETMQTPSPMNALGAKGVGEAGTIGTPPAVLNAVLDALAPLGVNHLDLPLTSESVWRAIKRSARSDASPPASDPG